MNRPLKLRTWDDGRQTFVPLTSLPVEAGAMVVEFTGVYDADGREIWEGDVVRWTHVDESTGRYHECHFEVVFQHGCFGTKGAEDEDDFTPFESAVSADIVVGHVFTQRHLLAQGTEAPWQAE